MSYSCAYGVWGHTHVIMCSGCQRTTLWSQPSPSAFMCGPVTKFQSSGLRDKGLYPLNELAGQFCFFFFFLVINDSGKIIVNYYCAFILLFKMNLWGWKNNLFQLSACFASMRPESGSSAPRWKPGTVALAWNPGAGVAGGKEEQTPVDPWSSLAI